MDDLGFDHLARDVGTQGTRRAATQLLAGGALGLLLGRLGLVPALAAGKHCRGVRDKCHRDEQCCSDQCKRGFCKCKRRGKCDTGKACCSRKCQDGKCEPVKGDRVDAFGCPPKKYLCFREVVDIGECRPVSLQKVEVPTCFTFNPLFPCMPGHGQCPRTPCQVCNQKFPQQCQGRCRAAEGCVKPGKGGNGPRVVC